MSCEVVSVDGIVRISGELTIYSAAAFTTGLRTVMDAVSPDGRVDASGVSEIDTAGLQMLLTLRRLCDSQSRPFTLIEPSDALREVLGLLHLDAGLRAAAPTTAGAAA